MEIEAAGRPVLRNSIRMDFFPRRNYTPAHAFIRRLNRSNVKWIGVRKTMENFCLFTIGPWVEALLNRIIDDTSASGPKKMVAAWSRGWYGILVVGWFGLFLGTFLPGSGVAAVWSQTDLDLFRHHLAILEKGGPIDAVLDRSSWPNHDDLVSYLEFELLVRSRNKANLAHLLSFLERWPRHAQRKRVERMVEVELADLMYEKSALLWYDSHPVVSTAARTYYVQLLLLNNRMVEAQPIWKNLFLAGMVLPRDLDEASANFAKQLSAEELEKRAYNLIKNGSYKTLREFLRTFPKDRRDYFLALAAATTGNEKLFAEHRSRLSRRDASRSELWYARIEWLRTHDFVDKAYKMLMGPAGRHLNVSHRSALRYHFAKFFYNHDQYKDAYKLLSWNAKEVGAELEDSLWLAAWTAYRLKYYKRALVMFEQLGKGAKTDHRRSQGAWWAAELSSSQEAKNAWIKQAAQFPDSFYGLLALEIRDGKLPDLRKLSSECAIVKDPRIQQDLQRMQGFRDMGRNGYNGSEIENLAQLYHLSTEERLCLAAHSGAYEYAIELAREMKKAGHLYWVGLYPIPHWTPSWGWQMDPAWIWGMVRQESMFDPNSKSSAQAQGLLQVIPTTAVEEAKQSSLPPPDPGLLLDPGYNLALGQAYMRRLLLAFKGDWVLALCSYNAGPGRGEKWSQRRPIEAAMAFIENIPFDETRSYVKLVINGVVHYQLLMYGKGSILKIVNSGEPGANKPLL